MPDIQLSAQSAQPFTESYILSLNLGINFTRFVYMDFLLTHAITGLIQFNLSAMPMITIPIQKQDAQIILHTRIFNGALRSSFQTLETRFQLRHDILDAFKI